MKLVYVVGSMLTFILLVFNIPSSESIEFEEYNNKTATSLEIYKSIKKYSRQYNVPDYIMFNMAFKETSYRGPFHWNYNSQRISSTGALGPMQIIKSTADWVTGEKIEKQELLTNTDLNVQISAKYLNMLYKRYKDWNLVCGYYNTGYKKTNDYSNYCVNNKDYSDIWLKY